ncbi:MAG: hypothetical protein ABH865_05360 [Candidatus Omnitrophota bacterium]|nr:hypothetical protein [Candidatus Omnitrophota bacterium]
MRKILALSGIIFIVMGAFLSPAATHFSVSGLEIPMIEAVSPVTRAHHVGSSEVATYQTQASFAEAVRFYSSFFSQNNFMVLGNEEAGEYNVAVKKEDVMFTMRIYRNQGKIYVQCIW